MKTNSKAFTSQIDAHILECVYGFEGQPFETIKEACTHVFNEFNRVANYPYNINKFQSDQERFSDFLNGLPFNFLFYYTDVEDFLNSTGINPSNKKFSDQQIMKRYHSSIYMRVIKNK